MVNMKGICSFTLVQIILWTTIEWTTSVEEHSFLIVTPTHCITNGSSALSLIMPINDTSSQSTIKSQIYTNEDIKNTLNVDCTMEEGDSCTNDWISDKWVLQNSLVGKFNQMVRDWRWEELSIIETEHVDHGSGKLKFYQAFTISQKNDFRISLSLRIEKEAHVFLCDDVGNTVATSKCYWVLLRGWGGTKSILRKCNRGEISDKPGENPDKPCKDELAKKDHSEEDRFLGEGQWSHIQIIKKDNTISVMGSNDEQILLYRDDTPFSPSSVFLQSRQSKGLWKLHNYTYLYCREQTTEQLGPEMLLKKGQHCIAMFIVTCKNCYIWFRLMNDKKTKQNTTYSRWFNTKDEKWTEIKLLVKVNDNVKVKLHITTSSENSTGTFWGIDNVRQCKEEEYRYLKFPKKSGASCQLIKDDNVATINNDPISHTGIDCPRTTFGSSCTPCKILTEDSDYCSNTSYCEIVGKADKICRCTSGYIGETCNKPCEPYSYGHGCQKKCGHCKCHYATGMCMEGQDGRTCDVPPEGVLKKAPKISESDETSCRIVVDDIETSGKVFPKYFRIQYKETTNKFKWITDDAHNFDDKSEIIIKNLKPDTDYDIRAVIYSNEESIYDGKEVPMTTCTTKCHHLEPQNIMVEPTNVSATVTFKLQNNSCDISKYEYGILRQPTEGNIAIYPIKIFNLQPCQDYQLYFRRIFREDQMSISKNFTTKIGIPSKVRDLKATITNTTAIITWKEPQKSNNMNQKCYTSGITYIVWYGRTKGRACPTTMNRESNSSVDGISQLRYPLINLRPYSTYEITVQTKTSAGLGDIDTITEQTPSADTIEDYEVPKIIEIMSTKTDISFYIGGVECDKIRGYIYLRLEGECKTDWCSKQNITKNIYNYNTTTNTIYTLMNLHSFVNYSLKVMISRDEDNWDNATLLETKTDVIMTKASVPPFVREVLVASKSEDHIFLRWPPPFPATGILKEYKMVYSRIAGGKNSKPISTYVEPSPCALWINYYCANITKDINGGEYVLQIWATNEGRENMTKITQKDIYVTATVENPDPPTDVTATWAENNILNVSWKHPNVTNGVVKQYLIEIREYNKNATFYLNIPSTNDYKLMYSYQINQSKWQLQGLRLCSPYSLTIKTYNVKYISNATSVGNNWSPPPIPTVTNGVLKLEATNHTITVHIPKTENSDHRNTNIINKKVFLLVSESSNKNLVSNELTNFENALRYHQNSPLKTNYSRLIFTTEDRKLPVSFQIGNDLASDSQSNNSTPLLETGREYIINVYYRNQCQGKVRINRLSAVAITSTSPSRIRKEEPISESNDGLYALILLLLLIPLMVYLYKRKKNAAPLTLRNMNQPLRGNNSDTMPLAENLAKPNVIKSVINSHRISSENTRYCLKTTHSKPVKISEYESYVKNSIASGELERQHALFPSGQTKDWNYGALPVNKSKNRYKNLLAYDDTRVKLRKIPGIENSDYINANYIDGYRSPRSYIATQGPKANTLNDFWRMIWQHKVENIVMLANIYEGGKKKVDKYWPDINEEINFSGIRVQYVMSQVFADYEYRVFNVFHNDEQRKVEQLHFTSWPDHGVPLYPQSLVPFLQKILKIPNSSNHPVVVHCSAGVGRTGTIILCDICLRMAAGEGSIDFLANLEHLRNQRPNMVDNIEQYKLVHLVVLECLYGMQTHIACDDRMNENIKTLIDSGGISKYMKYLEDTKWQDAAMDTVWEIDEETPIHPEKNRFQDIVPEQQHQVFLARYPDEDDMSFYINAIRVGGFRNPNRYIVTQQPMPNTVGDFWRLVNERQCTVIISLNEINTKDKTSCQFWPINGAEIRPVDYLSVRHMKTITRDSYNLVNIQITSEYEEEHASVTIVSLKNWMPGQILPESIQTFMSFWEESDVVSRKSDPVIVTCHDGATASGLYIAISFVIEKMKLEQECDVCLAVRNIRHNRPQFVTSQEQFEFLYRASATYIKGFEPYANFT